MPERISVADIKAMLVGRIRPLADELAPEAARLDGHRRWSLNPTRADTAAESFVIDVSGSKAGRWYEFAGGIGGDVIDLISYCRFAGGGSDYQSADNRGKAIAWARTWLGLETADPKMIERTRRDAERARAAARKQEHQSRRDRDYKAGRAFKWWRECGALAGTVGAHYLERARGLPLDRLGGLGALHFTDELVDKATGEIFPGIISAMSAFDRGIRGVHMTFLAPDGSGKAPITPNKKMWGDVRGTAIRLSKGASGISPEKAVREGRAGEVLAISEGIEDGLSWALLEPTHRVWAAGSLSFLGQVEIPASVSEIRVLGQNDTPGSKAVDAFQRQVDQLCARYPQVRVLLERPRDGTKDWNDLWREVA